MVIVMASILGTAALMAARFLALLTFALLCRSSASGAPVPSPCRFREIGCAESPSGRLFFVDRKAVDRDSFCGALGAAIRCSPGASPEAEEKGRLLAEHCDGGSSTGLRTPPLGCLSRASSVHLTFDQIVKVTQNFSSSQKIGEGGFGTVYKAVLPDGQTVAIKRARKEHFAALRTEFSNEVDLLAKIEHRCLVKLLGFIDHGNEKIIITEYVPNSTLREHLDAPQGEVLDFNQRMEIAIDIAHGLTYLHLYAGEADFTHYSTKVKGTFGYLDPEYLQTNQLTPKSDVFSFGVLLIEILSGRRPVDRGRPADERLTVKWAFKKFNEGRVRQIMDPLLREEVDEDAACMNEVCQQLWAIRKDYGKSLQRIYYVWRCFRKSNVFKKFRSPRCLDLG
ncbi:unnamed protein product [Spirodela intermedia]|uniref:non-specific serine/threonine protein kinase n=1 Tax=Spirodela intermedia TaxID=51605 RepID=A0A7I8JII5_SPIIN|nr:unnamed protein product [Spirodela intermedia]CAA6669964.1 unnamed protein product [Spirodela intermedia]